MEIWVKITDNSGSRTVSAVPGTRLSTLLCAAGASMDHPCGGRGVCGKCRVWASGQLSEPTREEKSALGVDLEKGMRLACVTKAMGDCEVRIHRDDSFSTAVTGGIMQQTGLNPRYQQYGIAVDIGTTTLAAKLCHNGSVIGEATSKNPQVEFGADVITRVDAVLKGGGQQLAHAVRGGINRLILQLAANAAIQPTEIDGAVFTGNTAMLYLLTGNNPVALSAAPFRADCLFGQQVPATELALSIAPQATVFLPPCIAAFVGADIVTAILASGITDKPDTAFLVDIGTNGEMALWNDHTLTCCSTAAGPAFEGAGIVHGMHGVAGAIDHVRLENGHIVFTVIGGSHPTGICGSGIVDMVAVMVSAGVLDEGGHIEAGGHAFTQRISHRGSDLFFEIDSGIGIYGRDIRAMQLAKSAVCAGLETLPTLAGLALEDISHFCIAGGFGSFLDLDSSAQMGLIPKELRPNATTIGNAALGGAVMLLNNHELEKKVHAIAKGAQAVNLSTNAVFLERYLDNMGF